MADVQISREGNKSKDFEGVELMPSKTGRKQDGTFQKGHTGNENGRPPKDYAWSELMRQTGSLTGKDKRTRRQKIIDLVYEKAEAGEMDAIKLIIAYEQGKPIETVRTQEIQEIELIEI